MSLFNEHVGPANLWDRRTCGTDELVRRELLFFPDQQAGQSYIAGTIISNIKVPDQQAGRSYGGSDEPTPKWIADQVRNDGGLR